MAWKVERSGRGDSGRFAGPGEGDEGRDHTSGSSRRAVGEAQTLPEAPIEPCGAPIRPCEVPVKAWDAPIKLPFGEEGALAGDTRLTAKGRACSRTATRSEGCAGDLLCDAQAWVEAQGLG